MHEARPVSVADLEAALQRVRNGERQAFETVVLSEAAFLGAWVRLRCAPGLDPEDIVQRSFITAYEQLASYQENTNFRAWLCRIAYHRLLTAARDWRRRQRLEVPGLDVDLIDQRSLAVDEEGAAAERQALRQCLSQLQDQQQELLQLRYGQGLAVQDIALRVDRSPGALSKSLSLLRNRLRDCVQRKLQHHNAAERAATASRSVHSGPLAAVLVGVGQGRRGKEFES